MVFLHGFGGNSLYQWYPQLREISKHYTVIAPDLLWFGESSSTDLDYSIRHQARAVRAVLNHEGIERFHVVGLSYGGMVSHELIGQASGQVERVVLIASPARAFLADDKKEVLADFGLTTVDQLLLPQNPEQLRRLMSLAYYNPPWVPRFVAQQVVEEFYLRRRPEHVSMLNSVERNTQGHRAEFLVPENETLIIWGSSDRVFPERAAWRLRAELGPRARLCVFDQAAHAPHLEREREVNHLMLEFLSGTPIHCTGRETPPPTGEML